MITSEEFVRRWGKEELVGYDASLVRGLNIADISRQFLLQAGMPKMSYVGTFDLGSNTLVPLTEAALLPHWAYGMREPFPESYARYRLLGIKSLNSPPDYFDEVFVCLDEQQSGKVVGIGNEPGYEIYFFNNSVPQLAEMLLLQQEDMRNRQKLDWNNEQEVKHYFGHARQQMINADLEAYKEEAFWWGYIKTELFF